MSVTRDFGLNIFGERSYKLDADISAFYFVIGGSEVGSVKLPTAAAQAGGRGILQHDGSQYGSGTVAFGGISKFRKSAAVISENDPLTPAASPLGSLRTAVPGEPVYAYNLYDCTATEEYGHCLLFPNAGTLVIPRLVAKQSLAVAADGELTDLAVPAGYRLMALVAANQTANAVTVKFGKTAGTQTIVSAVAVGASAVKDFTLLLTVFSFSTAQSIFVSSADWNSASLNVYALMAKLT